MLTIKKKCIAAYLRDASCHVIFVCRSTPAATTNKIKMLSSGSNHMTQTHPQIVLRSHEWLVIVWFDIKNEKLCFY